MLAGMPRRLYPCTPTRLANWLDCPRRYRMTYLDRPPPPKGPPWAHNSLGASVHNALAGWWRLPFAKRTVAAAGDLLDGGWIDQGYASGAQSAQWRESARGMVERYTATLDPATEPLGVERTVGARTEQIVLSGRVDRLDERRGPGGDRVLAVVDYKTGSGKPMKYAYEAYFGPELSDVQLALYYLACKFGVDDDGKALGFQPRFLSLWYPKDWVWGGMRQDIFSVGRPAGLKEYREKALTSEDLERSRAVVMQAIAGIKGGHFEPAPRELAGTCVTRFGSCPHAAICPYGGAPPE